MARTPAILSTRPSLRHEAFDSEIAFSMADMKKYEAVDSDDTLKLGIGR